MMSHAQAIEAIYASDKLNVSTKIVRLYSLAMLNYRQPVGDRAWDCIRDLTDPEYTTALAFLTGACMSGGAGSSWEKLVPEIQTARAAV